MAQVHADKEVYEAKYRNKIVNNNSVAWGFPSFVAFIGAAVYFISQTNGEFWAVIVALLKAIVWPAFVVFHVLTLLGA